MAPDALGTNDELLCIIEQRFGVRITVRGSDVMISGATSELEESLIDLFDQITDASRKGLRVSSTELRSALDSIEAGERAEMILRTSGPICVSNSGRPVRPYTPAQRAYVDAMEHNDVVFGIGPAGTGKTYLAAAVAVAALKARKVNRVVLVRPVVEAGEHLGYLPGDLADKIDPYLRPLYDAFGDLLPPERFSRSVEKGVIEVAPLAYMRGRTLNDSFIILDEAQNTTKEQMKMFLTRLGFGSKAVLTGDITQIDLPGGKESGLRVIGDILKGVEGVAFCHLTNRDVVRHELVQRIVKAYEDHEQAANAISS